MQALPNGANRKFSRSLKSRQMTRLILIRKITLIFIGLKFLINKSISAFWLFLRRHYSVLKESSQSVPHMLLPLLKKTRTKNFFSCIGNRNRVSLGASFHLL